MSVKSLVVSRLTTTAFIHIRVSPAFLGCRLAQAIIFGLISFQLFSVKIIPDLAMSEIVTSDTSSALNFAAKAK